MSAGGLQKAAMVDFQMARRAMVDGQVRTNDITNPGVIAAMLEIPREAFVPEARAALAYLDRDVAITDATATEPARYLMKPMVLGRLIQAADPGPQDKVLVIGAGTGYAAAMMSRLAANVVALEENQSLLQQAGAVLASLGSHNVTLIQGPLPDGAPAFAPYDVILIDGGVETVPDPLCGQLSPRGRLLAVVQSGPLGKAKLFQAVEGKCRGRELLDANAPVLPGFSLTPTFVF
jgi:protein-L-isoaspartate(D-aspartate) O-methyltransferase